MSNLPTGPDDPVARLYADGYDLVIHHGHLVVRRIPYLSAGEIRHDGKLVLPINDIHGTVLDAVGDHTIWFAGEAPCDERGTALGSPSMRDLGGGESVGYQLSFKPPSGSYSGLYEKVRHYARILRDAAGHVDSKR